MNPNEKKTLSKLVVIVPATVLEILKSKPECQTIFNLNKYVFFVGAIYSNGTGKEINSVDLYNFLSLNNLDGGIIKKNLIEWKIISEAYGASFEKNSDGKFFANNSAYLEVNIQYVCFNKKDKVDYIMYSDRAKFINKPEVFEYLEGAIVEKVTNEELKKMKADINKKRREKYKSTTAKPTSTQTPVPVEKMQMMNATDKEIEFTFLRDELLEGQAEPDEIKLKTLTYSPAVRFFRHKGIDVAYIRDEKTRTIEFKKVGKVKSN
jgi:uncharacterized protein YdbL (DUF1318 family)